LSQARLDLIRRHNQMAVAIDNPDEGGAAAQLKLSLLSASSIVAREAFTIGTPTYVAAWTK
jgi:hypothetical protein